MYAVVLIGGKQYKVEPGKVISVDKIDIKEGSSLNFDKVLAAQADDKYLFGSDASKATVKATVVEHYSDDKITVLKYKKRKRYRRTLGHKQQLTKLRITEINIPGLKKETAKEKPKVQAKPPDITDMSEIKQPKKAEIKKPATKKNEK